MLYSIGSLTMCASIYTCVSCSQTATAAIFDYLYYVNVVEAFDMWHCTVCRSLLLCFSTSNSREAMEMTTTTSIDGTQQEMITEQKENSFFL